jgi:peptide/nickel transport system substrate-binding protein
MSNYRLSARLGAVVAIGALTLAACGGGDSGSSNKSSGGDNKSKAAEFNAGAQNIVNPSDKTGGTLNAAATGDCDSWDPQRTYYGWCFTFQRNITRTLMGYAGAAGDKGTELKPDLAKEKGKPNDDKTEWTYTLRDNVKFEDGTPITSKDIKYGIQRLYATDIINGGPFSYFQCYLAKCDASGATDYKGPYKDTTGELSSIQTPDDKTIIFKLTKPYGGWDNVMALPASAPVPKAKDTGAKYTQKPVSSGPFKFSNYSPGKSLTLVRNDQWDQATDEIRKPKVDKIVLTIFSNPDDADKRLESGAIDYIADGGVQSSFQSKIVTNPQLKKNADNPITGATRYLVLMPSVPPLDNIECRKAIFYAVNKKDLLLARGGQYGGEIAKSMTPPGIPGHDKAADPYPSGADSTGDIEKAKQSLQACGQPNGFSVNMAYVAQGRSIQVFNAVQQALGRVGIKVNSAPGSQDTYYATYIGSPANIKNKKLGIAVAGWSADFPSGDGFWNSLVNGETILPTGNTNYASINEKKINDLLKEGQANSDDKKADEIYTNVDKKVSDLAIMLPFVWDKTLFYRNPRLTNIYNMMGISGYYDGVNAGVSDGK